VYVSRALTGDLLRYSTVMAVVKIAAIVVGSTWGVEGVAAGIAVAATLEWPVSLWWLSRRTTLPVRGLLAAASRILAVATCAAVASGVGVAAGGGGLGALPVAVTAWLATYAVAALVPAVRRDLRDVIAVVRTIVARRGRS
jgi:PST family polysaccharide transporter